MKPNKKFEEYTEAEYISLINRLAEGDYSSEKEHDAIVNEIILSSEHPNGTDVLYYPEDGTDDSPAGVLETIKSWRTVNGKPGFKTQQ